MHICVNKEYTRFQTKSTCPSATYGTTTGKGFNWPGMAQSLQGDWTTLLVENLTLVHSRDDEDPAALESFLGSY
jgi:hypothetical protein